MPSDRLPCYEFGSFRFDPETGSLFKAGRAVELGPKAAAVLVALLQEPGRVVTKERLVRQAWDGVAVTDNALTYQIHLIRTALGQDPEGRQIVETLPRRGYRISIPVTRPPHELFPVSIANGQPLSAGAEATWPFPRQAPTSVRDVGVPPAGPVRNDPAAARPARHSPLSLLLAVPGAIVVGLVVAGFVLRAHTDDLRVVQYRALTQDGVQKSPHLIADEAWVYYFGGDSWLRVPVRGGEPAAVFDQPHEFDLTDVGSSGADYLALHERHGTRPDGPVELWILPAKGGVPHVVRSVGCEVARWSPRSDRLACAGADGLSILRPDGVTLTKLPTPPNKNVGSPVWSIDGRSVRFDVAEVGDRVAATYSIWEVGTDGTKLHEVVGRTPEITSACCGSWSSNGDYFIFQVPHDGETDLWALSERKSVLDPRPARPFRLTVGPISFEGPTAGRDGNTIFALGTPARGELVRFDRVSGQFIPYLNGLSGTSPSFSPDGTSLAYVSYPDNALWRARADGTARRQLTVRVAEADGVAWSPDGRRIAFRSRMSSSHMKIYVMPAEGGEPVPISSADVEQGIPSWSADGTRLVFGDVPPQFERPIGGEAIHVYNLTTRAQETLPDSVGLWTARWSPDGRHIAALTILGQKLRIFDVSQRTWRSVPADHLGDPIWSHDNQFLYCGAVSPVPGSIRRVRVSDGRVDQVVSLVNYPLAVSSFRLAPDDSPLVLHSIGGQEIYALTLDRR